MTNTRTVLTVSLLNEQVRDLLENSFLNLWVEGEISNFSQPSSGHFYFTLKDSGAQIRAAMFKGNNRFLNFAPKNGQQVLVKAKLSLYAPRGDYQLIVDTMEEAGLGALRRAYDELRLRLQAEGLFDSARKRALPTTPQHIAVITSATGAAVRDIISVLGRRFAGLPVTVLPVPVQGREAAPAIVRAIALANSAQAATHLSARAATPFDVILLARGGGSLEDLWAFNEEPVARAIATSRLPVVSAIGHETDFTIADFVADLRAPTPSAAAELLSPSGEELLDNFEGVEMLLIRALRAQVARLAKNLEHLRARLRHPGQRVQELAQRLDDLELRLLRAQQHALRSRRAESAALFARLRGQQPGQKLAALHAQQHALHARLQRAMHTQLRQQKTELQHLAERAQLASPLAILARGYAVIENNRGVLRSIKHTHLGDTVQARVNDGVITATVSAITATEKT